MLLNKPGNTWNSRTRPYEGASPLPHPTPGAGSQMGEPQGTLKIAQTWRPAEPTPMERFITALIK